MRKSRSLIDDIKLLENLTIGHFYVQTGVSLVSIGTTLYLISLSFAIRDIFLIMATIVIGVICIAWSISRWKHNTRPLWKMRADKRELKRVLTSLNRNH